MASTEQRDTGPGIGTPSTVIGLTVEQMDAIKGLAVRGYTEIETGIEGSAFVRITTDVAMRTYRIKRDGTTDKFFDSATAEAR